MKHGGSSIRRLRGTVPTTAHVRVVLTLGAAWLGLSGRAVRSRPQVLMSAFHPLRTLDTSVPPPLIRPHPAGLKGLNHQATHAYSLREDIRLAGDRQ